MSEFEERKLITRVMQGDRGFVLKKPELSDGFSGKRLGGGGERYLFLFLPFFKLLLQVLVVAHGSSLLHAGVIGSWLRLVDFSLVVVHGSRVCRLSSCGCMDSLGYSIQAPNCMGSVVCGAQAL